MLVGYVVLLDAAEALIRSPFRSTEVATTKRKNKIPEKKPSLKRIHTEFCLFNIL